MKTMRTLIIAITIITALTMSFFGCFLPESPTAIPTGSLTINIGGISSRTILPVDITEQVDHYDILLSHDTYADVNLPGNLTTTTTVTSLEAGDWTVSVEAYDGESSMIASGSSVATIQNDQPNQVTVSLDPVSSGSGSLQIDFEWPAGIGIDEVLVTFGTDAAIDIFTSGNTATFTKTDVPLGSYPLKIELNHGGATFSLQMHIVQVWAYLETSDTIVLDDDDFQSAPSAPLDLTAEEGLGEITLSWDASQVTSESGFVIQRSVTSGSGFEDLGSVLPANTASYSDDTIVAGTDYYYRVKAVSVYGDSDYTAEAGSLVAPPAVTGLSDDAVPAKTKTWSWDSDDVNAEYKYIIDTNADDPADWTGTNWTLNETASVLSGDGTRYLHVKAKDPAGNESAVTTVSAVLDNTPPVITLTGNAEMSITAGESFTDPGVTVSDNIDSSALLEAAVVTGGDTVDTGTPGTYTITYNVSDTAGNAAVQKERTVHVSSADDLVITILLDDPEDVVINFGGTEPVLSPVTPSMTVTTSLSGIATYTWYIDGDVTGDTASSITVSESSLAPGLHTLSLVVEKDGGLEYGAEFQFTVEN